MVCACASEPPKPGLVVPASRPIEGADPSQRHTETVKLPAALRVERRVDEDGKPVVAYGIDGGRLEALSLDVGKQMVLGYRAEWTVRRGDGPPEWLSDEESTLDVFASDSTAYWDGIGEGAGNPLTFAVAIEVFETDIAPQHMWEPTAGRYRVLWRRTLTARLKG
jgi:hypothetical protein